MQNQTLVESMVLNGSLKSPRLIRAFSKIDRADFVRPETKPFAHDDSPLRLAYNQTISQPSTVAFMLELLQLDLGNKVMEVGAASGWTVALMASAVGRHGMVVGVERIPELVEFGQANLQKYGLPNAEIMPATFDLGLEGEAPFDRILVSAEFPEVPPELLEQMGDDGILVMPVDHSIMCVKKMPGEKYLFEEYPGFVFVPLIVEEP